MITISRSRQSIFVLTRIRAKAERIHKELVLRQKVIDSILAL